MTADFAVGIRHRCDTNTGYRSVRHLDVRRLSWGRPPFGDIQTCEDLGCWGDQRLRLVRLGGVGRDLQQSINAHS